MKICSLIIAAFALWAGGSGAQAAPQPTVAGRPVLWNVHFDAERLRSGAGRELFVSLDPILTSMSGEKSSAPGGKLESVAIFGFQPQKGSVADVPFLADIRFSDENGGVSRRFDAISKKHNIPIEQIAGFPAIHFQHQGKEVWIAKCSDDRVCLSASRELLELALAAGPGGFTSAAPAREGEVLGGNVEIMPLLSGNPALDGSELLKLIPRFEFHVLTAGEQLDVDASAELDSERSAKRAARMIDGMVAAVSMHDPSGVPWDERLALKQDGSRLAMQLHLEPREAKKLFDSFAREIQNHAKAVKEDE